MTANQLKSAQVNLEKGRQKLLSLDLGAWNKGKVGVISEETRQLKEAIYG